MYGGLECTVGGTWGWGVRFEASEILGYRRPAFARRLMAVSKIPLSPGNSWQFSKCP